MRDLRDIYQNPHPAFDVYPLEQNLTIWKVVVRCNSTSNNSTNSSKKPLLCCVYFRDRYPNVAPEIQFSSPISHPIINPASGWVDPLWLNRNWTPHTTIHSLFHSLYSTLHHTPFATLSHASWLKSVQSTLARSTKQNRPHQISVAAADHAEPARRIVEKRVYASIKPLVEDDSRCRKRMKL